MGSDDVHQGEALEKNGLTDVRSLRVEGHDPEESKPSTRWVFTGQLRWTLMLTRK
jgi:hypothetical protein